MASRGCGKGMDALQHRSGIELGELRIFKNLLRSDGGTSVLIHQTLCSNKFSYMPFTAWIFLIGFDSFTIHTPILSATH